MRRSRRSTLTSSLSVRGATYHLHRGVDLIGAIDHIAHSSSLQPVAEPFVLRRKFDGE